MSETKKLLIAYRLEGDAAKIVFAGNPDVAAESEVQDPEKGMAVLIQDEGALDVINAALVESLKMIKAGVIKEFVLNMDNTEHLLQQAVRTAELLSCIADLAVDSEEEADEDDDAE